MITQTFINLATKDVTKARQFFTTIGFTINETFSDANGICVVINASTFMMVMLPKKFEEFTKLPTPNSFQTNEVILSFQAESKDEVDSIIHQVILNGGTEFEQAVDNDFMYYRAFRDVDGHHFEVFYFKTPV